MYVYILANFYYIWYYKEELYVEIYYIKSHTILLQYLSNFLMRIYTVQL